MKKYIYAYLDDKITFNQLINKIGLEDAKAVKSSKESYDRNDEIIDDIIDDL